MVFQALRYLGKDSVGDETISRIRDRLTPQERSRLRKDAHHITDWIAEAVRLITSERPPRSSSGPDTPGTMRRGLGLSVWFHQISG